MHELVRAHGVRHAIQDGLRAPVDDDLAAAAQAQFGAVVVDVLPLRRRVADLRRNRIGRRVRIDLDKQLLRALEAGEAYSVGTENVAPV